jgi:salicylate hydroxylase
MLLIVVGGGVGGLATALAARRRGLDVLLLEQAPALTAVGAGIQLSPNCTRVLDWLGVLPAVEAVSVKPAAHRFQAWDTGDLILETPLMPAAGERFGAPYMHAHRADLLDAMLTRVRPGDLRLDAKVAQVTPHADHVEVTLAGGETVRGDVLVGADGIHSLVRDRLFRPDPPRRSGCTAWRGLIPRAAAEALGIERNSYIWMGPQRSLVVYYVAGGAKLNWVGLTPFDPEAAESWSATATTAALLAQYQGWHEQVIGMLSATERPFRTVVMDREPLPSWTDGRVALVGDAAHAMLPYHAQGAAQTIEDAWVLVRCLEEGAADVPAALARYQALRWERATTVQRQSREAERLFHLADAEEIRRRDDRMRRRGSAPGGFTPGQAWLFSYDAEAAVTGADEDWRKLSWSGAA